jgi:hypothetical protein
MRGSEFRGERKKEFEARARVRGVKEPTLCGLVAGGRGVISGGGRLL